MSTIAPKVFISYSWSVADKVLELAERLVNPGGVDVVLDKWDLKEGHDKYAFMEQAVNNPEVTHVLLICDKSYTEKANGRKGGVGDETVIISAEMYGQVQQEKFIPVVFEKDEDSVPFLPTYVKTRIYFDLSDEDIYEEQYEKLLRNLHGKPAHRKPKLSTPPEWLDDEDVSFSAVRDLVKQLKSENTKTQPKIDFLVRKATVEFATILTSLGIPLNNKAESDMVLRQIDATKPLRDYFVDYVEALISKDLPVGELVAEFFEKLYNSVIESTLSYNSLYPSNLEIQRYFIWESFICATAMLLHYERYADIHYMLTKTYFLSERHNGEYPTNYVEFRHHFELIENLCKPNSAEPRLHTLAGDITVKREKKPLITKDTLVEADLLLYQMSCALEISRSGRWKWFPSLCCYHSRFQAQSLWSRLKSTKHCQKLYPLFGVDSVHELKELISKCTHDRNYGYGGISDGALNILSSITVEEIATLN